MKAAACLLVLAACGDNTPPPPDARADCTATFTGNFSDTSTMPGCAMLAGTTLTFAIPTQALDAPLAITIQLPSTSPGPTSSELVADWKARGAHHIGNGFCIYQAGATSVPSGYFTLTLDDDTHGTLELTAYVLEFPGTDCGAGDTESLRVAF